jgi:hypothetical protein
MDDATCVDAVINLGLKLEQDHAAIFVVDAVAAHSINNHPDEIGKVRLLRDGHFSRAFIPTIIAITPRHATEMARTKFMTGSCLVA